MKSIKYKILINFCIVATVSIASLAIVVSWKITDSISQQSEKLAADMTTRMFENLSLQHQTFELLIREDIRRSVNDLRTSLSLIASLESGQVEALEAEQYVTAIRDDLDFILLFNLEGQLEASFPTQLVDIEVEEYFKSWKFGAHMLNMLRDESEDNAGLWDVIAKHDSHVLQIFGLGERDISGEGALSIVSAGMVKNDFDEPLGICLVGKLLNNYHKPLKQLHDIAGYDSVIYFDTMPVTQVGFDDAKEEDVDLSTLQIPPEIQAEIYNAPDRKHLVLPLAGEPYLITCSALESFNDEKIGAICIGAPESQITEAQQTMLSYGLDIRVGVQRWILGIGVISLSLFAIVSLDHCDKDCQSSQAAFKQC